MDINSLLANVLASTQADAARYTDAASSIGQGATAMEEANMADIETTRLQIPVAQGIAQDTANVDAQRGQLVQDLQTMLGLNPADTNNMLTSSMAELTATNIARKKAAAQVTELSGTSLLDDPFGYIMAQLTLPTAQAQLSGLDKQAAIVTQDMSDRLALSKAAQSTVVAATVQQQKTIAHQKADLAAKAAASKLQVAEAEVKSKVGAEMLKQADALAKISTGNKELYRMTIEADHWQDTMADRKEARDLRKQEIEARLKDKATKDEANATRQASLAAAYATLGLENPPDLVTFDRSPNTPQKKAIADLVMSGNFGHNLQTSLTSFLSADPNIAGIIKGGNPGFALLTQGLTKSATATIETIKRKADATGKFPSSKEAAAQGFDMYESNLVDGASNVKNKLPLTHEYWDANFSPYKADYRRMLSNQGLNADNLVTEVAKVIAPTVPADAPNFRGVDEQQILRNIAAMVATNKVPMDKAVADIAEYYQSVAAVNRDFYGYELMGLPKQTKYMVQVKIPGMFSDDILPAQGQAADLMNPVDVKRLLLGIRIAGATKKQATFGSQALGGFR